MNSRAGRQSETQHGATKKPATGYPYRPLKSQEVLRQRHPETAFRLNQPEAKSGAQVKSPAWCGALSALEAG
jgi:hypothetical protein